MKQFLTIFALLFSLITSAQQEDVYVRSYVRNDGTYVPNHHRTPKNETINDNYTTQGNINPYTGKLGTIPRSNTYTYKPLTTKPVSTSRSTTPSSTPGYNYSTTTYPQYNSKPKASTSRRSTNSYIIY